MATARQSLSAIKDAGNTYIIDNQTKKVFLYIPYANTAKFTFKGNDVSAKAKGEDCVTFNLPSELSIELGVQLMNLDILGFITGSTVGEAARQFTKREVFDITASNKSMTDFDISGNPYGDKVQLVKTRLDQGDTIISEIPGTFSGGKFTPTSTLTLEEGERYVAYYFESKTCDGVSIKATPEKAKTYTLDTIISCTSAEDSGEETFLSLLCPKIKISSDFSLDLDATKPCDLTIKMKANKDKNGNLLEMRQIPEI